MATRYLRRRNFQQGVERAYSSVNGVQSSRLDPCRQSRRRVSPISSAHSSGSPLPESTHESVGKGFNLLAGRGYCSKS
ncbi:MAG: hypothetical protein N3E41_08285 [Thermofilaceae archaeon]|nr:hypothetical protein [Thermofilaceae archaeon]